MIRFKLLFMGLSLMLLGCASVNKDYSYMSENNYKNRMELTQSLIGPNDTLSEADVQRILSSKIVLPKNINLAVVRLLDSTSGADFQTIDKEMTEEFYDKKNWGGKIQSIIPVPQVMMAKPVTMKTLRQAAVLLQADLLLILKPVSYGDVKYQFFKDNKAHAVTTLEILLLDTRTSIVPYTSLITETVELGKEGTDYNDYEMMARAKKASELKALMQVAPEIQKFLLKMI